MTISADIIGFGRELHDNAKKVVIAAKERRTSRETQKRQVAQKSLTQLATVLSKTTHDIRQGGLPEYSLSFLNDTDQGIGLILDGTGLSLAFDEDQVCIEHRGNVQGIPSRSVLTFTTYQEGRHIVDEAKAQFQQGTRTSEYPLTLNPQEPGFEEDGVVRQLSRHILEQSKEIFSLVTEAACEQLTPVAPRETATSMENDQGQPLTQEQQYLLQNPFPDVASRVPPIAPYHPPHVEDAFQGILPNDEKAPSIAGYMEGAAQVISRLGVVTPEDLPYADTDPQLARYVAANSLYVYAEQEHQPIGILSAQPDDGTLIFQLFSGQTLAQPTVFFRDISQVATSFPTVESIQAGYAPYANPYDNINYSSVGLEDVKSSTQLAQTLLTRLATERYDLDFNLSMQAKNGMPYIGMEPQTFFTFAEQTLTAAIPDKEAVRLDIDYFDYSVHGTHFEKTPDIPDFALSFSQKGNKQDIFIWFDEALQTTTVQFEITRGEDTKPYTVKLSYTPDSFTVTYMTEKGPKTTRITPELFEDKPDWEDAIYWRKALYRIGKTVRFAEDVWSMVQGRYEPFVTDTARLQIDGLFDDLAELIRREGDIPNMSAYIGGNPTTLLAVKPLHAGPDVWLPTGEVDIQTAEGNVERLTLRQPLFAPSPMELESYPDGAFLGQLAREARLLGDTDEHPIPFLSDGSVAAKYLFEHNALDESPFGQQELVERSRHEESGERKPRITKPLAAVDPKPQSQTRENSLLPSTEGLHESLAAVLESFTIDSSDNESAPESLSAETPSKVTPHPRTRKTIAEGTREAKEKAKANTKGPSRRHTAEKIKTSTTRTSGKPQGTAPNTRPSKQPESRQLQQGGTSPSSRRRKQEKTK